MSTTDAMAILAEADDHLDRALARAGRERWSLSATGARARSLVEVIGPRLASADAELGLQFATLAAAFLTSQLTAFPDNLLWDLDRPLGDWWDAAIASPDPCATARASLELATSLQHTFGRATVLGFRYTHDFVYGYDWAKWVARDRAARAGVGPFDLVFLEAMRARAEELVALIRRGGDAKYPVLSSARARNPFPFSREPDDELAILRALAQARRIPVAAWDPASPAHWDEPWAAWREQAAAALGLDLPQPEHRQPELPRRGERA
jgi:hypothetical protein